jgi:hypothetical protein
MKWIIAAIIGLVFSQGSVAMSLFKSPTHCVFSAISGTLTLNGEPVKNARVVRSGKLGHAKKSIVDEITTDENGYFSLPDMYQSASEAGGLVKFVIFQTIQVTYQGKKYDIWDGAKYDGNKNSESRGRELNVKCELSDSTEYKAVNGNNYYTNCMWDVVFDVIEDRSNHL